MPDGAFPPSGYHPAMPGPREASEAAPAKINLGLEILGRRADGYHELETVFQTIELADRLLVAIEPGPDAVELTCSDPTLPSDARNLAWKAAAAVLERMPGLGRVVITLDKRLPHGAGLGGGSSDAAAVLRALARLDGRVRALPLPALAAALGSDVPFFLLGGTAHAGGRGELLTALDDLPDQLVTLLMPAQGLATPGVFAALSDDERGPRPAQGAAAWGRALAQGPLGAGLHNRLAGPARRLHPGLDALLTALERMDTPCLLCGSGAACVVFGPPPGELAPAGVTIYSSRLRPRARLGAWP